MEIQAPNTVLMIEPAGFGFNDDAFATNKFQVKPTRNEASEVQKIALKEFSFFVEQLNQVGVSVIVYKDTNEPKTPDAIFPNNWISTHQNGKIVTYPMQPLNRRLERRKDIVNYLINRFGYSDHVLLEKFELEDSPKFLEGTGSMVFDHNNKTIYAAISPRTSPEVLNTFSELFKMNIVSFKAFGSAGEEIYHTNVMLCIGETFAVVGKDTIDESDRDRVLSSLTTANKEVIYLSNDQIYNHFAGNMLQLRNQNNEKVLVMSMAAKESLTHDQFLLLKKHNDHIVSPNLSMIEKIGGGSARCMLAEIFLPK